MRTISGVLAAVVLTCSLSGCGGAGGIEPGISKHAQEDPVLKDQMKAMSKTMLKGAKSY